MDMSHGAASLAAQSPVQVAKAALRRLALDKIEPTPENYARAYAAEGGHSIAALPARARPLLQRLAAPLGDEGGAPGERVVQALMAGQWDAAEQALDSVAQQATSSAQGWADLLQRLARGLERGSRLWTAARKKDSLARVLSGSRADAQRLRLRVLHLIAAWESETDEPGIDSLQGALDEPGAGPGVAAQAEAAEALAPQAPSDAADWQSVVHSLELTLRGALPQGDVRAAELAQQLAALVEQLGASGATPPLVEHADALCQRARRLLTHRQHLLDELGKLCLELTQGLTELAEDDSWAEGQCKMLHTRLAEGLNVRSVRAASDLLAGARKQQALVRGERNQARDALKQLIQGMLTELDEFSEHTGRFHENVGRHAEAIAKADSIGSLAGVVREMLDDSKEVQALVSQTQTRLRGEQARAGEMQMRVRELEGELRRLSDEVSTDALTQVANRRGLAQAFEAERARLKRARTEGAACGLAVGLIDIDNFKRLNDTLGHAAGDVALQKLAAQVRDQLRPLDTVARFGGEEFVVLLPDTDTGEAQSVLTRLQRKLTASLFMHDNQEIFVTFSAGVTALRESEALELALERADEALYEAKRTGKNRTCIG